MIEKNQAEVLRTGRANPHYASRTSLELMQLV